MANQKKLLEALLAGPRGGGNTSPEAAQKMLRGGPFNAWMRSPDLGNRLQNVGEHIRYRTSLPLRLNEFAILITAGEWTSQYGRYAHYPLAMKAGLDAKVADELALGTRPSAMSDDEAAVTSSASSFTATGTSTTRHSTARLCSSASGVWSI
jgi:4-carboxymuconolactone decarboxylase